MYLAVVAAIVGQALAAVTASFVAFVRLYAEPVLERRFGVEYEAYRRAVPGWWPRLLPWKGDAP